MAFGESSFGDNSARPSQRGRGRGGLGGGGGNRSRNRNRNRNNNGQSPQDAPPTPSTDNAFTSGDVGAGDPFDSGVSPPGFDATFGGAGSMFNDPGAAGDADAWRATGWGLLNQGGVAQDRAMGGQQAEWLDGQMQDWYDQWEGRGAMSGSDANTWVDEVLGMPGTAAPTGGVSLDYLRNQWGPEMQRYLTARYQSQTPRGRGTDSTRWSGPRRVIQFLFAAASAATLIAEFVSRHVQV